MGFSSTLCFPRCCCCRYEYVLPEWVFDPRVGLGRSALVAQAAAEQQAAAVAAAASTAEQQAEQQQQEQQEAEQQQEQAAGDAAGPMEADAAADGEQQPAGGEEQPAATDAQDGAATAAAAAAAGSAAGAAAGAETAAAPASPAAAAVPAVPTGPFVFDEACVERMNAILKNVRAGLATCIKQSRGHAWLASGAAWAATALHLVPPCLSRSTFRLPLTPALPRPLCCPPCCSTRAPTTSTTSPSASPPPHPTPSDTCCPSGEGCWGPG